MKPKELKTAVWYICCTDWLSLEGKLETQKWSRVPLYPCPPNAQPPLPSVSPTGVKHLLQLMNLHGPVISPIVQFLLKFTLGDVHSRGFDKYIMSCIYYYSIIWSTFTALKILCFSFSSSLTPRKHWYFYTLHSFAFPRIPQNWNHTLCSLCRWLLHLAICM